MATLIDLRFYKANKTADTEVPDMVLGISENLPNLDGMTLGEIGDLFEQQAQLIERALYKSLPGGTYDHLVGAMLQRKATHFVVTHGKGVIGSERLLAACEAALAEMERITGDTGFEPDRFRERMALLQQLDAAVNAAHE